MVKVSFSQQSVENEIHGSSKQPCHGSCSVSSDMSSNHGDHWHSDENSSQASSTWSSSTQPHRSRSASLSSYPGGLKQKHKRNPAAPLPPPVLVYHESARSIVFRDHVHRVASTVKEQATSVLLDSVPEPASSNGIGFSALLSDTDSGRARADSEYATDDDGASNSLDPKESSQPSESLVLDEMIHRNNAYSVDIKGFQPQVVPLPRLQLGRNDEFEPLIFSEESKQEQYWTESEKEVHRIIMDQRATIKTIKNTEWTVFLNRFKTSKPPRHGEQFRNKRDDIGPHRGSDDCDVSTSGDFPYNSFFTSTTLLPSGGKKMRAFGSTSSYTIGCVFAIPSYDNDELEDEAVKTSHTWSWPSGYSAKTEFNIDERGNLINGREEALVPLSRLRMLNDDYVNKSEYVVGGRVIKGGLKTVPYNEVFLRVGGRGRRSPDGASMSNEERSFEKGVGLPVAIFCRTASFGHLFSLLRARARLLHAFGENHMKGLPLLMITPDLSVRVLTEKLQHELLKVAARHLNPFQNSLIAHKTKIDDTDPNCMQTKLEELIDLDEKMRETLTTDELARIAGGFGATDDSVAQILRDAMIQDKQYRSVGEHNGEGYKERHELQDIVNEGLAASVRASDYYTSRQLLILYSLVSSEDHHVPTVPAITSRKANANASSDDEDNDEHKSQLDSEAMLLDYSGEGDEATLHQISKGNIPRPPPPPLDTDRLRSATNSDGLLAVLGAAQILRAMQDGGAKKRTKESWEAVEEWVEHGEQNIAFRLASWRDQRAAQDDLEIAVDQDSRFMAFVSGKAITNRKSFARQLHQAVEQTDFNNMRFLLAIDEMISRMHSPCLRLELLQYVLGLDNRYSIEHVKRAVELAATCLNISCKPEHLSGNTYLLNGRDA